MANCPISILFLGSAELVFNLLLSLSHNCRNGNAGHEQTKPTSCFLYRHKETGVIIFFSLKKGAFLNIDLKVFIRLLYERLSCFIFSSSFKKDGDFVYNCPTIDDGQELRQRKK